MSASLGWARAGALMLWLLASISQHGYAQTSTADADHPAMTPAADVAATVKGSVAAFNNPVSALTDSNTATQVQADEISGQNTLGMQFNGNVEIAKPGLVVRSRSAFLDESVGEISVFGQVEIDRGDMLLTGDKLLLDVDEGRGQVENVRYEFGKRDHGVFERSRVGGKSSLLTFDADAPVILKNATFTTCRNIDAPDWYLKSSTLELDQIADVGAAYAPRVYFKEVPILALPYATFPLSGERKSGVLPPTFEYSSNGGFEWRLPIYWNIAPNRDLLLTPNFISQRGMKLDTTARYLEPHIRGDVNYDSIDDKKVGAQRYLYSTNHYLDTQTGIKAELHYAGASDNNYLADFSRTAVTSSQRLLPRSFYLQYQDSPIWQTSVRVSSYQLLQDQAAIVTRPYDRLPQINVTAGAPTALGITWKSSVEYTRFWQPDTMFVQDYNPATGQEWKPQFADRTVMVGALGLPLRGQAYFFEPKYSYNQTFYEIGQGIDLSRSSFASLSTDPNTVRRSRGVGTFSVDSGLVFERDTTLGNVPTVQTLEPRLFYVNTPYVDQAALPNFDSSLTDFSYAQIFSPNPYTGDDRIADVNQVTMGLTTRLLNASNGSERARFALAERFSFTPSKVQGRPAGASDILVSGSGFITPQLKLGAEVQYNLATERAFRETFSLNWHPDAKKALNLAYRTTADTPLLPPSLEQYELSGQWPLTALMRGLYGVGQAIYSLNTDSVTQQLWGLEYHAECWVLRFVAQKFNPTTTQTTTNYYLQLEFSGWSRIGINPLDVLRSNIANYN